MGSADRAVERTKAAKWREQPIKMIIKRVVEATGEEGLLVDAEIKRLTRELVAKEAALEVLIKDFAKVNNKIVELRREVELEKAERKTFHKEVVHMRKKLAEAGK